MSLSRDIRTEQETIAKMPDGTYAVTIARTKIFDRAKIENRIAGLEAEIKKIKSEYPDFFKV